MSYIRKMGKHWQCLILIKDHTNLSKTFEKHEDAGMTKIKYPTFNEIGLKYIVDISITKKGFINERNIINSLFLEPFSTYPTNKIKPDIIGKFRDRQSKTICGTSII